MKFGCIEPSKIVFYFLSVERCLTQSYGVKSVLPSSKVIIGKSHVFHVYLPGYTQICDRGAQCARPPGEKGLR